MFENYFKIAYRNLLKNRVFSVVNILGLAIGMACSILIFLWVKDELSYDRFHKNHEDIYRLVLTSPMIEVAVTSPPMAAAIKKDVPAVEEVTRVLHGGMTMAYQEQVYTEPDGIFADPSFLDIFSFKILKGDTATALTQPYTILITEKLAQKYFPDEPAIGKKLLLNHKDNYTVTGILQDVPNSSHLKFDYVLPMLQLREREEMKEWDWYAATTYVLLKPGVSATATGEQITDVFLEAVGEPLSNREARFYLQPLNRIHLYSNHIQSLINKGNILYVQIFTLVAFIVLLIACINFMNLSTARSAKRSREVGLRKVVGAHRHHLIRQFIGESVLMTLVALLLALTMVEFMLPLFNNLADKSLTLDFSDGYFILGILGITFLTGTIAGSYPAVYLSKFEPAQTLKGAPKSAAKGSTFRKALVVFQFTLSIMLIISTLVVYNQMEYLQQKQLGYDKEQIVFLQTRGELRKNSLALQEAFIKHPAVQQISGASHVHTSLNNATTDINWPGKQKEENVLFYNYSIDYNYLETLGIELVQGRSFSRNQPDDSTNFLINETAAKRMQLANPVGQSISMWDETGEIVGVVKDFHFRPMHEPIEPLIIRLQPGQLDYLVLRLHPNSSTNTLSELEEIFRRYGPKYPFEYQFLDSSLQNLYKAEKRLGLIFRYFAFLAIFISCLGLFGLASFTVEQRRKEIGVRKVLGASVFQIFLLISKDFTKLVLLAFFIAVPAAYIAMNRWLDGFAYRTSLGPSAFLIAGALALFIALITVSYQTIRTARANPIKSLRYE